MKEKLKSGEFEGPYLDVKGYRGTLKFSFAVDDTKNGGNCQLTLRDTEEPIVYSGPIIGDLKATPLKLKLNLNNSSLKDDEDSSFTIETTLTVSEASSYAEQAIFGIISASAGSGLGGSLDWLDF